MIIGLFLRHIKAYKGIQFIPIGEKYNFSSYIGENGAGKSSVLEALDSFFNNKKYLINKSAMEDGISGANNPYILPIFLIEKNKISKKKKEFEKISDFFWSIERKDVSSAIQGSMKRFFELKDSIKDKKDSHYLILIGETNFLAGHKMFFGSFHTEVNFLLSFLEKDEKEIKGKTGEERKETIKIWEKELSKELEKVEWKKILQELKNLYSYVYLPVELEVESFTKIETDEMQKIFDKTLKDEISTALASVDLDSAKGINKKLDSFILEIEETLNSEYCYQTDVQRGNKITKSDLVDKIIESYFQKRILNKKEGESITKKVSELSAGEKRQALVNLVYAFLVREKEREKMIIIGIDEPENSLHTSLCYDQFEKLNKIAENNQILITTHWYGFLPIVTQGFGHFLDSNKSGEISFESYDLYDYKPQVKKDIESSKNRIPNDFLLKSTNDLVQSIFYSIRSKTPYNWLIVEGVSEKIYFEYLFKEEIRSNKLRILPLGGASKVWELYKYLKLPINNEAEGLNGKIWCLIDTDQTRILDEETKHLNENHKNLRIRRLSNKNSNTTTELITLSNSDTSPTDIEQALNPEIFKLAIDSLNVDPKYQISTLVTTSGNTSFIKNFKNLDLEDFFKKDQGYNKLVFAEKYIEKLAEKDSPEDFVPNWVNEIKKFLNN